ncbi:MAG TPA: VOC family protein [Gemmatimonadales bacterium]|jgi:predicted enzyme related to lactoylglutathione lyase|nr:VOC family protein [Gemmatimonadales bacterium]
MHGKICYIEMPAADVPASAKFYADIFGWKVRRRGDGATAFDDTTGGVSGTWVPPEWQGGSTDMVTYIMVDSITDAERAIAAAGGQVTTPRTPIGSGGGAFAIFTDPAGNRLGLYEEPGRA